MNNITEITCPICCSTNTQHNGITHKHAEIEYKLYKSPNCDTSFWEPRFMDSEFYSQDNCNQHYSHDTNNHLSPWLDFTKSKELQEIFMASTKILDIGCGNGSFLSTLSKYNLDLTGIDMDPVAINAAKKNTQNARFLTRSIDELITDTDHIGQYDVVCIFEVLEHQDNPVEFLEKICILLKKKGTIVGSTPNSNRISAKIGLREPFDYPPNHFFWFTQKSLEHVIQQSNLHFHILTNAISWPRLTGVRYVFFSRLIRKFGKRHNPTSTSPTNPSLVKSLALKLITISMLPLYPILALPNRTVGTTLHFGFVLSKKQE